VECGRVDVSPMVTHQFPLGDWRTAFEALATQGTSGAIKIGLRP
jgi:threonine dehydrogenase-like Zn-dependent dehydrogenase